MNMEVFTGVVLLDSQKRIYLIKEEDKNKLGPDRWNLPGGSVDAGEDIIESAQRETLEETGYQNRPRSIVGCYKAYKSGKSWIYIVLETEVLTAKKTPVTDPEVKEGHWFGKEEFLKMDNSLMVHPDMKLVYKIATEKRGLSLDSVKFINYDEE